MAQARRIKVDEWEVDSLTNPGTIYIVVSGAWSCTCPSFVFQHVRICKHILLIQDIMTRVFPMFQSAGNPPPNEYDIKEFEQVGVGRGGHVLRAVDENDQAI